MKDYMLLMAMDVLEFIERLPRKIRLELRVAILKIGENPLRTSDATEYDPSGRLIQILIVGDFALKYWIDDADIHVKILDIYSADR